jgi:serine/threonine protein kinase/predicted XRE-type DNA-binding protein
MAKHFCKNCNQDVESKLDAYSNAEICSICGTPFNADSSHLAPGTIISGFQVEEEIGRGGMGVVYKAKQLNLERHVALKILSDELSRDSDFVDHFFREARSAASLSHPNIVQAFDAGATAEGIYYFAMELIEGEPLENRIERDGQLNPKTARGIAVKIADALSYAWEKQKLSHGDIKPDNIILNSSGGAKLADLGLAKSIHEEHSGDIMATPLYAPPEVIKGELDKIGFKSDMYSFGATLYHMLAGVPPFLEDDPDHALKRHLEDTHTQLIELNPDISPNFSELVDKLLEKDPADRPDTWADVVKALAKIRETGSSSKVIHTSSSSPTHSRVIQVKSDNNNLLKVLIALIVLLLLVLLSGGALLYKRFQKKTAEDSKGDIVSVKVFTEAEKEWIKLKKKTELMSMQNALEEVKNFIAKYKKEAPQDSHKYLTELSDKIFAQKKEQQLKKQVTANFNNRISYIDKSLKKSAFKKYSIKKLHHLGKEIEAVFALSKKYDWITISKEKRNLLNNKYLEIESLASKKQQLAEQKRLAEAAKQEAIRLQKEKEKLRNVKLAMREAIRRNEIVDSYYLTLGEFIEMPKKKRTSEELGTRIEKWISQHKSLPGEYQILVDFIKKNICEVSSVKDVFIENEAFFKDKELPSGAVPSGFMVEELDSSYIRLYQVEGKVRIGKKLKWSKLKFDYVKKILQSEIFSEDKVKKLKPNQQGAILSFLILQKEFDLAGKFLGMSAFSKPDQKLWKEVINSFKIAPKEKEAIDLWLKSKDLIKSHEYGKAVQLLGELYYSYSDTDFGKRHKKELRQVVNNYKTVSPEIQASDLIEKFNQAMDKNQFDQALALAMVGISRYSGIKTLKDKTLKQLSFDKVKILAKIKSLSSMTVDDNKIPFLYWENENPGDAWIFAQLISNSKLLKEDHPIMPFLRLSADVDLGNWPEVNTLFMKNQGNVGLLKGVKGPLCNWTPSFAFGFGVAAKRYQQVSQQNEIRDYLNQMSKSFPGSIMEPLVMTLAMEYSLETRNPDNAINLAEGYNLLKKPANKLNFKIAFLHLLALLRKDTLDVKTFNLKLAQYTQHFSTNKRMANDLIWSKEAANIINIKGYSISPNTISNLNSSGKALVARDISSRLLLSALSRAYCQDNGVSGNIAGLINILDAQVSANQAGSDYWWHLQLFKIARASIPAAMSNQIRTSLSDYRICGISSYPQLMLFHSGFSIWTGALPKEAVIQAKTIFLKDCSIASEAEKNLSATEPKKSSETIKKVFSSYSVDAAFELGVFRAAANAKNPAEGKKYLNEIIANPKIYSQLTWEEKYLLKVLTAQIK